MSSAATLSTAAAPLPETPARGGLSWALFEFARAPTFTLIFMFVFAPYFSQNVVGDPIRGQQMWGLANTLTGAAVALLAPLIGAAADRMGRRKTWMAAAVLVQFAALSLLWLAEPGGKGELGLNGIVALIVLVGMMIELSVLMHNSLLALVAPPALVGRVSGLGFALGNVASFTTIVAMLTLIALPATGQVGWTILPDRPIFGLDPARFEHARIAGPIAAWWLLLFSLPFFLRAPDAPATGIGAARAFREGFRQLAATVRQARSVANVGRFLLARMIYNDAIVALQAYCAIYAAGVFGWDSAAILIFAVLITGSCILGGLIGGRVDTRLGSRRTIISFNIALAGALILSVSFGPDRLFFLPFDRAAYGAIWSFPYFRTLPELAFLATFLALGVIATVVLVSSRAMLARIAPLSSMTQFFGLFSLSGYATAFLGHGLVALATGLFASQRAGFLSVLLLLGLGLLLMFGVREERSPDLA